MKKNILPIFLLISLLLVGSVTHLDASPVFSGNEQELNVSPTKQNYYLATLTGETEYYDPVFYDDYLISIDAKPVLQFTKFYGEPVDFYYYISDKKDIEFISNVFARKKAELDKISPKIYESLDAYRSVKASYSEQGLHSAVSRIIEKQTNVTIGQLISKKSLKNINAALFRYLESNGISSLDSLNKKPKIVEMLVNKFYMLSDTCFFREWINIERYKGPAESLRQKAYSNKKPFKVCVFACSSGEEVFSYAMDLMELGVKDFTILASDINDGSLAYAARMKYPYGAYALLPQKKRYMFKKYFKFNTGENVWEPKDPDFFKARIKFIKHDILTRLPDDLEERFAPPYDILSILNVLFYLDDDAVEKSRDYWKDIIASDGILVVHDTKYSFLPKLFGLKKTFDNFTMINEWVNVKNGDRYSSGEKLTIYEENYKRDPSETNLLILNYAFSALNQWKTGVEFNNSFLSAHPYSLNIVSVLLEDYIKLEDDKKIRETVQLLSKCFVAPNLIIDNLIKLEDNKAENIYLKGLNEKYHKFLETYKTSPGKKEEVFDFNSPFSAKWDAYRLVFKIHILNLLKDYYKSEKSMDEFENVCLKGIDTIADLEQKYSGAYPVTASNLDLFVDAVTSYYIEKGYFEKALELTERVKKMFENRQNSEQQTGIPFGLANVESNQVKIYEKLNKGEKLIEAAEAAEKHYSLALEYSNTTDRNLLVTLYKSIGEVYFIEGKQYLSSGDRKTAIECFKRSLKNTDKCAEIGSLHSQRLTKTITELMDLAEKNGFSELIIDKN